MTVTQTDFRAAVFDPGQPAPHGLSDAAGRPAGARFDVYRNNVAVGLTEALETGFPVIRKLIGEENFSAICGIFLRRHPPKSPVLFLYGDEFPDFLRGFEPLAHLGYLGDVAALEMAMRHAYHAADATPLDPEVLGRIAPDDLPALTLALAPALRQLRSPWPIHDIWAFNTHDNAPKPRAVAQDVLITRPDFDPIPRLLPPGGAEFISALSLGQTLGEATDAAHTTDEAFDLTAILGLLLSDAAIVSAQLQGPRHDPDH